MPAGRCRRLTASPSTPLPHPPAAHPPVAGSHGGACSQIQPLPRDRCAPAAAPTPRGSCHAASQRPAAQRRGLEALGSMCALQGGRAAQRGASQYTSTACRHPAVVPAPKAPKHALPAPTCSASAPSSTAFATSVASARVGRGAPTIESIRRATTTGLPATLAAVMAAFCTRAIFSGSTSKPSEPLVGRQRRGSEGVKEGGRPLTLKRGATFAILKNSRKRLLCAGYGCKPSLCKVKTRIGILKSFCVAAGDVLWLTRPRGGPRPKQGFAGWGI